MHAPHDPPTAPHETSTAPRSSQLRTGWRAKILARVTASDEIEMREFLDADKRKLLTPLHGTILEIGPGTGPNFAYYAAGAHVIGLEPNAFVQPTLVKKAKAFAGTFELRTGSVEAIPLPAASVDAVVSTMVLCSVPDAGRALAEIRRVLKPGGKFAFIEHVLAPPGGLRLLQYVAAPAWHVCGDGCCPVRRTYEDIDAAGFTRVDYRFTRYGFTVPVSSTCIVGSATK
ncbi:MAG: class I SAM-dependent methyltransferase [Myxococcales bacterium FL481]|nr:MAG: class I SAM-dependent methyltransferase [Myxococcales bacterium FL481]